MRDFLESAAVILVIILQVINVILSQGVVRKVDKTEEEITHFRKMFEPTQKK